MGEANGDGDVHQYAGQAPVGSSVGLNCDIWERQVLSECRALLQMNLYMEVSHHSVPRAWNFSHRVLVVSHHKV